MPVSQRVDQVEFRGNTAINSLFSEVVKEKETSILILEPNVIDIFPIALITRVAPTYD